MSAVVITLTLRRRNKFIDCQKPMYDWQYYLLWMLKDGGTRLWSCMRNPTDYENSPASVSGMPISANYWPLLTMQHEWNMVKYVMVGLSPFRYRTQWMSKQHMVTLHHVITVFNTMFNNMDGFM